jgi:hypothetical protein
LHSDKFRQLSRQSFASLVLWAAYGFRTELDVHPACPLSSPGSISTNVLGPILTIQEAIKQFGFEEGRVINTRMSSCPNAALVSARKPKSNATCNCVRNSSNSPQNASEKVDPKPTRLVEHMLEGVKLAGFRILEEPDDRGN